MSYKRKLGIKNGGYIFNREIDDHFKSMGFYDDTMNPRFMNGYDYDKLSVDEPVLRHDSDYNDGGVIRVFMNTTEVYVEVQTPYRSYEYSSYEKFEEPPTSIDEIEEVLDRLTSRL